MYKKMLKIQKKISGVVKGKENPYFKSSYFDINALLEVLKPDLNAEGLLLLQPLTFINGKTAITTKIIDVETGEMEENTVPIPECPDPQKMGSAITYYRRYSLQSMFGLMAEDDDSNHASGKNEKKKESKPKNDSQKPPIGDGGGDKDEQLRAEILDKINTAEDAELLHAVKAEEMRAKAKAAGAGLLKYFGLQIDCISALYDIRSSITEEQKKSYFNKFYKSNFNDLLELLKELKKINDVPFGG